MTQKLSLDDYDSMLDLLGQFLDADIADISLETLMQFKELSRRFHTKVDDAVIDRINENISSEV